MSRRWSSAGLHTAIITLLLPPLGLLEIRTAGAADPESVRSWMKAVVSIEGPGGRPSSGSGVTVSERGHVVTTWAAVAGLAKPRIRAHDGSVHDVVGWAAADRGRELVLLSTTRRPAEDAVARLVDRFVAVGEPVHALGGPRCAPMTAASNRIDAIDSGERFLRSLSTESRTPLAADQCRIVHHAYLPPEARGGGLFSDDGLLYGILVDTPDWTDRVHVAVHAGHVRELIEAAGSVRPMSSLPKARIEVPCREAAVLARNRESLHLPPFDGDAVLRGGPLRERLRALREALAAIPAERRRLAVRAVRWDEEAAVPRRMFEDVQRQIAENRLAHASMEPECEIRDGVVERAPRRESPSAEDPPRVFSAEQQFVRGRLDAEYRMLEWRLATIRAERLRYRSFEAQSAADAAALDRLEVSLLREVFFAGDPFSTRRRTEILEALPELDAEIGQGRPAAVFLLVRGAWYARLDRQEDALADFDRIADEDRSFVPAAELAADRCGPRGGRGIGGRGPRARSRTPPDAILDSLRAGSALAAGDWTAARRALRAALDHGGDPGTIHEALARLTVIADGEPRVAAEHARLAAAATLGTDWRAWGLSGLASAMAGDADSADETLALAEPLATAPDLRTLRAWRECVRDGSLPVSMFED